MKSLLELFPRASQSFIRANEVRPQLQNPIPEQVSEDALDGASEGKGTRPERVIVRITSYRVQLLDSDNAYGGQKPLLDAITEAKLITDDNPEAIELIVRQRKVAHRTEERTRVEIEIP